MSITLLKKQDIIKTIKSIASNAKSIILTNYRGLTSPEITELRIKARSKKVDLLVTKNSLLKIGFENTNYSNFKQYLKGPILLFISKTELNISAKLISEFCKNNDKLKVNIISLSGKLFKKEDLNYISNLPTYKEAISSFVVLLKTPIGKLIKTIKAPNFKLLMLLIEVNKKKK